MHREALAWQGQAMSGLTGEPSDHPASFPCVLPLDLFDKALAGEPIPRQLEVHHPKDRESIIFPDKRTTFGVVEMTTGCDRRCQFCLAGPQPADRRAWKLRTLNGPAFTWPLLMFANALPESWMAKMGRLYEGRPLAIKSRKELLATIKPSLQRYLRADTGDLPEDTAPASLAG